MDDKVAKLVKAADDALTFLNEIDICTRCALASVMYGDTYCETHQEEYEAVVKSLRDALLSFKNNDNS